MDLKPIENKSAIVSKLLHQNNLSTEGITEKDVQFFAMYEEEIALGIGAFTVCGVFAMLRSVCIDHRYQKRGLGNVLCNQLFIKAKELGLENIYLLTDTAEGFFKKQNFNRIKREELPIVLENNILVQSACSMNSVVMYRKNLVFLLLFFVLWLVI